MRIGRVTWSSSECRGWIASFEELHVIGGKDMHGRNGRHCAQTGVEVWKRSKGEVKLRVTSAGYVTNDLKDVQRTWRRENDARGNNKKKVTQYLPNLCHSVGDHYLGKFAIFLVFHDECSCCAPDQVSLWRTMPRLPLYARDCPDLDCLCPSILKL